MYQSNAREKKIWEKEIATYVTMSLQINGSYER